MTLSIIIVSYNVKHYLGQCLRSVQRAIEGMEAEVWVLDNHSRDGSVDYLRQQFPWVNVVASNENLGFARGNNRAIRQSAGRYVLLLNPDTVVGEDVLRHSVQWMESHPRCGGIGVRMLHADGSDALESRRGVPTPMTAFYKMTGLCGRFPQNHRLGRYYMGWLSWDEPAEIEVMSGAYCMLRREALDQVGLLDEDFFMYGEDIDLSYRLLKGGWHNWYLPLKILHYKGESTEKTGFRYVHVFYQAMYIFLAKHYGHLSWLLGLPIRAGIALKATSALCSTLWQRTVRSLGFFPKERAAEALFVFDVSHDNVEQCRRLARQHALTATFADSGRVDLNVLENHNGRVYWVYDLSRQSYREMLEHLSSSQHDRYTVATFDPSTGIIITPETVL